MGPKTCAKVRIHESQFQTIIIQRWIIYEFLNHCVHPRTSHDVIMWWRKQSSVHVTRKQVNGENLLNNGKMSNTKRKIVRKWTWTWTWTLSSENQKMTWIYLQSSLADFTALSVTHKSLLKPEIELLMLDILLLDVAIVTAVHLVATRWQTG